MYLLVLRFVEPRMSDEDLKLTRRHFLQQSAAASALAGGAYCISQKTDALAADPFTAPKGKADDGMPYPYHDPP